MLHIMHILHILRHTSYLTYFKYMRYIEYIPHITYVVISHVLVLLQEEEDQVHSSPDEDIKCFPIRSELVIEGFEDDEGDALPRPESRKNKNCLELTRSGRPSIKKNDVDQKFTTKYGSPSNTEKILGKLLPIAKSCSLISTAILGPELPLEKAGHAYRLRTFQSAVYYCLDEADLSEILDSDPPALLLFLKGIFQAACRVLRYEMAIAA